VPLKTMCSMKWLIPVSSGFSCRLPRFTQTPTATLRTWGMASVTRVRPLSRISLVMAMSSGGAKKQGITPPPLSPAGPRGARAKLPSGRMDDRDYQRHIRINLPHARTIVQRLSRSLVAQGAFPEEGTPGDLHDALLRLEKALREFDEDPPAEEGLRAGDAAAEIARGMVEALLQTTVRSDRLGQHVRNLFECLGLAEEGATLSLQCGERPDSPLR